MSGKQELPGITIYGAATLIGDGEAVDSSAIYLMAEMVDDLIANGTLQAGTLNNVDVRPSVDEWPERWRFLKGN